MHSQIDLWLKVQDINLNITDNNSQIKYVRLYTRFSVTLDGIIDK